MIQSVNIRRRHKKTTQKEERKKKKTFGLFFISISLHHFRDMPHTGWPSFESFNQENALSPFSYQNIRSV